MRIYNTPFRPTCERPPSPLPLQSSARALTLTVNSACAPRNTSTRTLEHLNTQTLTFIRFAFLTWRPSILRHTSYPAPLEDRIRCRPCTSRLRLRAASRSHMASPLRDTTTLNPINKIHITHINIKDMNSSNSTLCSRSLVARLLPVLISILTRIIRRRWLTLLQLGRPPNHGACTHIRMRTCTRIPRQT
jgi:hypothetical protein